MTRRGVVVVPRRSKEGRVTKRIPFNDRRSRSRDSLQRKPPKWFVSKVHQSRPKGPLIVLPPRHKGRTSSGLTLDPLPTPTPFLPESWVWTSVPETLGYHMWFVYLESPLDQISTISVNSRTNTKITMCPYLNTFKNNTFITCTLG